MNFKECKKYIKLDLARITNKTGWFCLLKFVIFNYSFKITFWFRIGSYLKEQKNFFAKILYPLVYLIYRHNQYLTGIQLPLGTNVGPGLSFSHFSCIVINASSKIGSNVTIFQGVTIGSKRGEGGGVPVIGDNVVISSGSQIIGFKTIGDNVIIGAGSVVVHDIPSGSVAVGVPAKVVSNDGEKHTQYYLKNY